MPSLKVRRLIGQQLLRERTRAICTTSYGLDGDTLHQAHPEFVRCAKKNNARLPPHERWPLAWRIGDTLPQAHPGTQTTAQLTVKLLHAPIDPCH